MTPFKIWVWLIVAAFALAGCGGSNNDAPPVETGPETIFDLASADPNLSTLASLLTNTGLDEVLDGSDEFTVLAPTNAAFSALGQETLDALANDPDALKAILLYHVVPGVVDSNAVIAAVGTQVTTVNGSNVAITSGGEGVGVRVNFSDVTAVDISAENGVIHVIDSVLTPPTVTDLSGNSITTIAKTNPNLSTLVSALTAAGLDSVLADLDSNTKYTVFAPTNEAFAAIDSDALSRLIGATDVLSEVLLQHVVAGEPVDAITAITLAGTDINTASGNAVSIDIANGMLSVGGANLSVTNIIAENGIIHVIDQVIIGDVEIPAPVEPPPMPGGETGPNLAVNGDFENGLEGYITTPSVTIADENGNNYASAEVTSAGTAFSVNISQVLTLEAGEEYVLNFRARATQDRSIIAGIGFNFAPFYANVEEVSLTTEWQTFSLTLPAIDSATGEDLGGENNRIIFDLGAAVGDVHIDDIELLLVGGDSANLGEELVQNAQFSDGLTGWVFTDGAVTSVIEGDSSYASAEVTEAGNAFSVNISQVVSLELGARYILSFDSRAAVNRTIIAGIGLNYAPFLANIEEVSLTTEWQSFELTLDTVDDGSGQAFGDENNRIIFDLGAAVGNVNISNVSLKKVITGGEGTPVSSPSLEGYSLVWSDEFDGAEIDSNNWGLQLGDGSEAGIPGWGNQELQIYTDNEENASIGEDDGNSVLMITAREDGNGGYTSARLNSSGLVSVRYGKITGRMKLPETQSIWPAFWLLGDANEVIWPGIGEIDIMELTGDTPDKTFHTVHYVNGDQQYNFVGQDYFNDESFSAGYNEFMIDWTPEFITWYVNGEQAFQLAIKDDMKEFQRSFHFILNVAVGGTLPGSPDSTTVFPQTMYVDYVRVYQRDDFVAEPAPPVDVNEETVGGSAGTADANEAIQAGFTDYGTELQLNRFGAGGEPSWSNSEDAIDGAQSVQFSYPGGAFGGGWINIETPVDLTLYNDGALVFAIKKPDVVANLEVKLEGDDGSAASMFLVNYSSTDLGNGWEEYRIPVSDIVSEGLSLDQVTIPFALWNPVDSNGEYPQVDILFDAIRLE